MRERERDVGIRWIYFARVRDVLRSHFLSVGSARNFPSAAVGFDFCEIDVLEVCEIVGWLFMDFGFRCRSLFFY